jgi:hypothetical protein
VELSPLVRVIPVGEQRQSSGVTVELLAVEVREAGAVVYRRARAEGDRDLGEPALGVADDAGTSYRLDWAGFSAGGSRFEDQIVIRPAPLHGKLIFTVGRWQSMPPLGERWPPPIEGAWEFVVPLEDGQAGAGA